MKLNLTYMSILFLIAISNNAKSDSDLKRETISKQFLECTLKVGISGKYGFENFNDLATVKIEKYAFIDSKNKFIGNSISVDGNYIVSLHVAGKDFRNEEDEYYAHGKGIGNDYDVSININRQSGSINYSAIGRGRIIDATGKCNKIKDKKF